MARTEHIFRSEQFSQRRFTRADALVIFAVGVLIYLGVRLALRTRPRRCRDRTSPCRQRRSPSMRCSPSPGC